MKAGGKNAAGMRSPLTRWQLFLPQLQMEIPQVCVCLQRPPPPASSPPRVREMEQRPFNHSKRWGGQVAGTLYSLTEAGISTATICMTNAADRNSLPCKAARSLSSSGAALLQYNFPKNQYSKQGNHAFPSNAYFLINKIIIRDKMQPFPSGFTRL